MTNKEQCKCGKIAVWWYMPDRDGDAFYCDDCVRRGCSCNTDENGVEDRDEKGRLLPCCEYGFNENGYECLDEVEPK